MFPSDCSLTLRIARGAVLWLSFLLPIASHAQPAPPPDLVTLMRMLAQVPASEARFSEEKHNAVLARPLLLSGRLSYVRGGRVTRTVLSPHEERLIVQGDTLTIENPARGTQSLSLRNFPAAWAFVEGFRATLAGDLPTLERFYRTDFSGSIASWSLQLFPREEEMASHVQSITFRGNRSTITSILVAETGGGRSLMKITPDAP